ncbi:3-phosphoserine/phosphohydroxythreonine transaminase [Solilutibacter silvestris]|uniref:Phosphoserine aminotransferase n=1 Tax=Solilutibacter silvestris TaxID=1645665 RepID=A0A2K1PYG9_9GAMM|nr:3-phosphoserine/phosphohydroxythreonine transaminase [Lysobacter silvestris]PNS07842.1 phosphoserine transaminase [Lysobacter silvestris]
MARVLNFSAGPAVMPEVVLRQAQEEMLDWRGTGACVAELSHRGAPFMALASEVEADVRNLLAVPESHAVLFLAGGATTLQALLPLNIAKQGQRADYLVTGHWAKVAMKQAAPAADVHVVASGEAGQFRSIPPRSEWQRSPDAAYFHVTANETIHGVELPDDIDAGTSAPLIADFSSNIASRPSDLSRYAMVYAGAQKNLGPSGITLAIIRKDLLERRGQPRADILTWASHAAQGSMLNTPPTWNWYLLGLCVRWMIEQGGTAEFARRNGEKSALVYAAIDDSEGFYRNDVVTSARSRMNIPFVLHDAALDAAFLAESQAAGLIGLKGHKAIGGMRASLYNAMPVDGVRVLVDFMHDFRKRHG